MNKQELFEKALNKFDAWPYPLDCAMVGVSAKSHYTDAKIGDFLSYNAINDEYLDTNFLTLVCTREEFEAAKTGRSKKYWDDNEDKWAYYKNPLTDDALCFRLMVKYELIVGKAASGWSVYTDSIANFIVNDNDPNRAICLAIIEAHKC